MQDPNEKYWLDLVTKLKKELIDLAGGIATPTQSTILHNKIWSTVNEAFRRGQKQANGFGMK